MGKILKVGIIGVGGIAKTHFPGWRESPHAELAALVDINDEVLSRVGQREGVTRLYNKVADLLADKEIDIVDICVPNMYHTELTVAALKAGKHVLCEKPLAPTPADIKKMIAARDKSRKLLMTAQHFRFDGRSLALKSEIARGVLGNIYHARSWMLRRDFVPVTPAFVLKQHSGGGPCIDIGVHILDLTLWMMGNPKPVTVSGVTQDPLRRKKGAFGAWGEVPKQWDVEEFASAFVRFETGATLILEVAWMLHHNTETEDMQMWLYGDKAGCHWPENDIYSTDNATKQHFNTKLVRWPGIEAHAAECIAFADAVANGRPSPVPAEQSLDVITILDALYQSAAKQREVVLKR